MLLANLIIADRIAPRYRSAAGPEDEIIERYRTYVAPYSGRLRVLVAAFFALVMGGGVSAEWRSWILFQNSVDFGVKDPQFDRDIGFYVFRLPFLEFAVGWLFAALLVVLIVTAVFHYLNGGIRLQSPWQRVTPQVKVHLSVILALMALTKTVQYYLARYELVFSRPRVRRRRELHGREGAVAGVEPADGDLDRRGRALHRQHLPQGLGVPDHRGRALGFHLARRRHDLSGGHPAFRRAAERVLA